MISVVIPLYNKENCIRSTIESVLGQRYEDFELIIVDDGSTDGSVSVVKSFEDPRIQLICQKNAGVSVARNAGIRRASSDYVAFLDSDDLWDKDFLKEIFSLISDYPEAAIWGTSYRYLSNGETISANKPLPQGFRGIIDNHAWTLGHLFCSSAVCCRKSAIDQVGAFDERIAIGEDLDLWWRLMYRYSAAFLNKDLATYRFDMENRAMRNTFTLSRLHIFYFEKYNEMRAENAEFRHFIDKECMWWLFPYFSKNHNNLEIKRILSLIDFKEYKTSFRLRFSFPRLYNLYQRLFHK